MLVSDSTEGLTAYERTTHSFPQWVTKKANGAVIRLEIVGCSRRQFWLGIVIAGLSKN